MRIALFAETYLPNVSGVVTHVHALRVGLEHLGHQVLVGLKRTQVLLSVVWLGLMGMVVKRSMCGGQSRRVRNACS